MLQENPIDILDLAILKQNRNERESLQWSKSKRYPWGEGLQRRKMVKGKHRHICTIYACARGNNFAVQNGAGAL